MNFNINMEVDDELNKKISDEGKIWVEGNLMNKGDLVNLTNKVLFKANYKKKKHFNVKEIHVGEGKLSITLWFKTASGCMTPSFMIQTVFQQFFNRVKRQKYRLLQPIFAGPMFDMITRATVMSL